MSNRIAFGQVLSVLVQNGFSPLDVPVRIGSIAIDFAAAFLAPSPLPDLVVVEDTSAETEQRLLQKLEGTARALDVLRSKRPLTAILVGARVSQSIADQITRVCRVLSVPTVSADNVALQVLDRLAVLLPLQLPQPGDQLADSEAELRSFLNEPDGLSTALLAAAQKGTSEVQRQMQALLSEPIRALGASE